MSPPAIVSGGGLRPFWGTDLSKEEVQNYLDFLKANHVRGFDSARGYGDSEKNIGKVNFIEQGFLVDTKIKSFEDGIHAPEKVHESFNTSISLLNVKKVHILYLHSPDRKTPFEDTLRAINEIYQSGGFEKFGLSNYSAKDIEEIVAIADKHGWVRPTVYQGNYNFVTRRNEKDLFPILRKEKIAFYAYSPLAGGLLTGEYKQKDQALRPGSRFERLEIYKQLYFKDSIFGVLNEYAEEVKKYNLTPTEVAIRWVLHHSILNGELGDAVIFGGSSFEQVKATIGDYHKGPLPLELVHFIDNLWPKVESEAPVYHY